MFFLCEELLPSFLGSENLPIESFFLHINLKKQKLSVQPRQNILQKSKKWLRCNFNENHKNFRSRASEFVIDCSLDSAS